MSTQANLFPEVVGSAKSRKRKALSYAELVEAAAAYVAEAKPKLQAPSDVANVMRPLLQTAEQEEFHVLLLNTKYNLIRDVMATKGLVDRSQVHAREVFREAIRENATRIILVHNHPSGDPTPSAPDIACTRDLVAAGKIIGIAVMDHIIIGKRTAMQVRDYLSFREEGLIGA